MYELFVEWLQCDGSDINSLEEFKQL